VTRASVHDKAVASVQSISEYAPSRQTSVLVKDGSLHLRYETGVATLTLPGEKQHEVFNLVEITFSTPSGHHIDGQFSDGELSMIHRSNKGEHAVISCLFNAEPNVTSYTPPSMLRGVFDLLLSPPLASMESITQQIRSGAFAFDTLYMFNASSVLPQSESVYQYSGSLAVPPCTESTIFVLKEIQQVKPAQLSLLREFGFTARPTQPINGRIISRNFDAP
jgi:carbonic anhydrase